MKTQTHPIIRELVAFYNESEKHFNENAQDGYADYGRKIGMDWKTVFQLRKLGEQYLHLLEQ